MARYRGDRKAERARSDKVWKQAARELGFNRDHRGTVDGFEVHLTTLFLRAASTDPIGRSTAPGW